MVYLSFQPSSHEILRCPSNTATPSKGPFFFYPLVIFRENEFKLVCPAIMWPKLSGWVWFTHTNLGLGVFILIFCHGLVNSKLQNPPTATPPAPPHFLRQALIFFFIHFTFKNAYSVHVAYGSSKDTKLGISGSNSPPRQWSNSPIPQHKWWWDAWQGGKLISALLLDKLKFILLKNHI